MEENNAMEMPQKHENAMLQLAKVVSKLFFYLDDGVMKLKFHNLYLPQFNSTKLILSQG